MSRAYVTDPDQEIKEEGTDMRQSITTGLGLLAVGVASARAAAGIAGHGLPSTAAPTARAAVAAGMAAGSCTGLGVVALLTGWAHRSR